jgi:hypothetical protein
MQLTTVLSDSFVAITACIALKNILEKKSSAHILIKIIPFSLMVIAACTGVLRFSLFPNLEKTHEALSAIGSHVGMIFLFVLFYSMFIKPFQYDFYLLIILSVVSALSFYFDPTLPYSNMVYTKIAGTIAVFGIIGVCISQYKNQKQAAVIGLIACLFSMIAGVFQEFKITAGPLLSLDLFHYGFSVANVLWGVSLKKASN